MPTTQSDFTDPKIVFSLIIFLIVGFFLFFIGMGNLMISGVLTGSPLITLTEINFYALLSWVGFFLIIAPLITVIVLEGLRYSRRQRRTPVFPSTPRDRPRTPLRRRTPTSSGPARMPPLDRTRFGSQETPLWSPELAPPQPAPPTPPKRPDQQIRLDSSAARPTSPLPRHLSVSEMTKGIRRLEAKVARIQKRVTNPKVPRKYAAALGEKACEREANAQLLEALNTQRSEGRISSRFYRRKRRQLTKQSS